MATVLVSILKLELAPHICMGPGDNKCNSTGSHFSLQGEAVDMQASKSNDKKFQLS